MVCERDDRILEDLVQRRADMDIAVRIGRTVMQREFLAPLGGLTELLEQLHLFPALQQLGLEIGQPRLHRKIRFRQEQRLAPIAPGGVRALSFGIGGWLAALGGSGVFDFLHGTRMKLQSILRLL